MQKFILTTIAIIVVALTVYVYYGNIKNTPKINTFTLKKSTILNSEGPVEKKKILTPEKAHLNKKIENNPEVHILSNNKKIIPGEDITIEDIENSDVDQEEKKRMMDDMLYFQSLHMKVEPKMNEKEILNIFLEDLKTDQML